jgi:hypothetical protein
MINHGITHMKNPIQIIQIPEKEASWRSEET